MSGNTSHSARTWIVHDATKHLTALVVFSWSDLRQPLYGRPEASMAHSQRRKNVLWAIRVKRNSAHALHHCSKHDKVDIAVNKTRPRWRNWRGTERHAVTHITSRPGMAQIQIRWQSRKMRKQVTDCDIALSVLSKLGNVFHHRIVESDFALLEQLHHGGRSRNHFCERRDIEDRVDRHGRSGRLNETITESLAINHLVIVDNQ